MKFEEFEELVRRLANGSCESFNNQSNTRAFPFYVARLWVTDMRKSEDHAIELYLSAPSCLIPGVPQKGTNWNCACKPAKVFYFAVEHQQSPERIIESFFEELKSRFYLIPAVPHEPPAPATSTSVAA